MDFFVKLAWNTYEFEQARKNFGYTTHTEFVFLVSPCPQDPLIDSHNASHSYLPSVLCNYCESSDHAACHCPYRAYVDATCASVKRKINELADQMVATMKKRIAEYSSLILCSCWMLMRFQSPSPLLLCFLVLLVWLSIIFLF